MKKLQDTDTFRDIQRELKKQPEAIRRRVQDEIDNNNKLLEYWHQVWETSEPTFITDRAAITAQFVKIAREYDSNFNPDTNRSYYSGLVDYLTETHDHPDRGLLIYGNIGSGKTLGLYAASRIRGVKNPILGRYVTENRIVSDIRADKSYYDIYTHHHLIIDDLGTSENDYDKQTMKRILEDRYLLFKKDGKKTHITTNVRPAEFADAFGPRLADRLKEMCNIILLTRESLRK